MPEAPNLDGLPLWLQIVLSLVFGAVTLVAGFRAYQSGPKPDMIEPKATIAHLADMGAVRSLTDACHDLSREVSSLCKLIGDQTHYLRDEIDVDRELCQRLRELREVLEGRSGR